MGSGQQAKIDAQRMQLAEQEGYILELETKSEDVTDTFFTQEETIKSLSEFIKAQDQKVTYVSPPAPTPQRPNYFLYAGIAIAALFIFGKVKL